MTMTDQEQQAAQLRDVQKQLAGYAGALIKLRRDLQCKNTLACSQVTQW